MEGGLEALPVNETSGSDGEMSVDPSAQCGFMVDWGLFVLAARWSAAFPFLFASPASVVAAFCPCGPALSPESWRHPGYFSYCFQPCVCDGFSCVWRMQDLEGLGDALLGTPAAATVYMECDSSKHAAAASAAAVLLTGLFAGLFDCLDRDIFCLVDVTVHVKQEVLVGLFTLFAAAPLFLFNELSKLAAAALKALEYLWTLGVVYTVVDGAFVFLQLVGGCFASFHEYICIPGGLNPKGKVLEAFLLFPFVSLRKNGQVDYTPDCDQGSGKHGIVSSLPVGLGQASGRVDVPDDAKIEAAAAFGGTLRSGPGSLDALGSARSREGKIQFFLKGHDGCTRVINCHDGDLIHDVVGYVGWDIYATLHGHILDLSGTLQSQGVSDNDTIRIFCRLRGGSNNTDIPGQWQCANCDATRCWPVRRNCYRCGAPRPDTPSAPAPWNAGRARGRSRGPLGRDPPSGPSSVPPTTRAPRVVPPRGPPGAGVGTPPRNAGSDVLPGELLGALKLLQAVMSAEDFSKYEKLVAPPSKEERTKEREQLFWEKVQSQNRLRKQEAGHVEQIAKLEADAAKQRAMLQSVREQLEAVNDEVCALRALVADPSVPSGPTPEPPPLPAPRTPPPPSQDLLDIAQPLDQEMGDCENEEELEWPPVRRFSHSDRRNKLGVIKGFTKHRRERSLTPSKHVILDDDELPESMGKDSSGKEIADMLCNMPHEKLLEVVQNCPASMLQQFVPNVPAAIVVENPASLSG